MTEPTFTRNALIYTFSSLLTKVISFVLLPLYTFYLSPEDVGKLSLLESGGRLAIGILSLALDTAFGRYYFYYKNKDPKAIPELFSTHILFIVPWALFIILITSILIHLGIIYVPISGGQKWLVEMVLLGLFGNQIMLFWINFLSAEHKASSVLLINLTVAIASVSLTILFLTVLDYGWFSRLVSISILGTLQIAFVFWQMNKNNLLVFNLNLKMLCRSLRYSFPLIINLFSGWILMFSDRFIMAGNNIMDQVGVYSLAAQIVMILYFVNDGLSRSHTPFAMDALENDATEAQKIMSDYMNDFLAITLLSSGLLSFSTIIFVNFGVQANFSAIPNVVLILAWLYVMSGIYRVFTNVLSYAELTSFITLASLVQILLNVALNFLTIPQLGMYGAAISSVICIVAYTIILGWRAQRVIQVAFEYKKIFRSIAIWLVYSFGSFYVLYSDLEVMSELSLIFGFLVLAVLGHISNFHHNFSVYLTNIKSIFVGK